MKKTALYPELKPYKAQLWQLVVLSFLSGLCTAAFAWNLTLILDGVFLKNMDIIKAAPFFLVLLFITLFKSLLYNFRTAIADSLSLAIRSSLRTRITSTLLALSPLDRVHASTGEFLVLAVETIDGLDDYFSRFLPQLLYTAVLLPLLLLIVLPVDLITALIFFITAPLVPFLLYLIGQRTRTASIQQWTTLTKLTSKFTELLQGLLTLKIFNRSYVQVLLVAKLSDEFRTATLRVLRLAFVSAFAIELLTTLSIALIAVSIGLRLLSGSLTFNIAFFVLLLAPEFYLPLRQSGAAFHIGMNALAAAKKIYAFLDTAKTQKPFEKKLFRTPAPYEIHFSTVGFHYLASAEKILQELSFTVKAGSLTMLAGASGSGKSTILQLLLQFAQPTTGKIYINKLPLSHIESAFWHSRVAYVPQQPHIFRASIADNIALAVPLASLDDIRCAAKAAALDKFIQTLPNGYATQIGDGFVSLSMGQIRRLGLARALLQKAPLLLLDEISAGLDLENETTILQTLQDCRLHHTILMTAHRPEVLTRADHIFLLDGGKISFQGTYNELLASQSSASYTSYFTRSNDKEILL
jgi:ATP-binding cassette subfamily C protein CydD